MSSGAIQSSFLPAPEDIPDGEAPPTRYRIRVGTASWTDPTLIRSGWYPPGVSDAAGRLRHYASRFSVVEADAPYYAIPSATVAESWVRRTPGSFTFDVKASALLTGHRTDTARLPLSVRQMLGPSERRLASIGAADLTPEILGAVTDAFGAFVQPLRESGRLGAVLFQYPRWFVPGARANAVLDGIRRDFPTLPIAVEFRNAAWGDPIAFREVTARMRALRMTYVGVDAPRGISSAMVPIDAVTDRQMAILRLHGRNARAWDARHTTAATRFDYRYDDAQLAEEVTPRVQRLADEAAEVHVIFNNCHEDDGVRNAATLAQLVGALPAR